MSRPTLFRGLLAIVLVAGVLPAAGAPPPLKRDLSSYFILGMRHVHLKNFQLPSACNVGANCPQPTQGSSCGVVEHENPIYGNGSQIAGDVTRFTKPGGSIWQLFRNDTSPLDNVQIRLPGTKPDGSSPVVLPILADLDGDGTPSCAISGTGCAVDLGDIQKACGFPDPFPACDAAKPVTALLNADCSAYDAVPGNKQCDLPAGTYGRLTMQNDAIVQLTESGNYAFCDVFGGRRVRLLASGAVLLIPPGGGFRVNNASTVGMECGDVKVLIKGPGPVSLGRYSTIAMKMCAPESTLLLGHGNKLTGQFVGDIVDANDDNVGECCGRCACFDEIVEQHAAVGATVTLKSGCDLTNVVAVTICGIPATIVAQAGNQIQVIVPAGAAGACVVEAESPTGVYVHGTTLTVP